MATIENVHLIEEVFGRFPSFHDAEVLRIELNRETGSVLPTIKVQIYVFEMTSEVKDGKYVLRKHSIVTFQFAEIEKLDLSGFNQQNVLSKLSVRELSAEKSERSQFEIHFEGIYGVDARFMCRAVKVIEIEAGKPARLG